jgi:signal transduction histidine kinase
MVLLTNSKRKPQSRHVILAALRESMRAVQATLESEELPPEQLVARLDEWRQSTLELSRSLEEEERGEAHLQLAALYELSHAINSSLHLDETLNTVIDTLIEFTGAERGCLVLIDEKGRSDTQIARNFDRNSELELSRSVMREAVERGQPVLTTNAQIDPRFSMHSSVIDYQLRSILCVPLRVRGEVIGALYLDNRAREGVFSESDLTLLTAFANQAATAIENARLYTMTDQALAERVRELTMLQKIDQELNASLDFHRVLDMALAWAMRATDANAGTLSLVKENGEIAVQACAGNGHRLAPPDPDLLQVVLRSHESITIGKQRILVPIRCKERTLGVLDLHQKQGLVFSPEQAELAGRLADHAAIAIENARLYDQVHQANQAKTEFVSLVAHELRTPMTSIRGYADMLAKEMLGPLTGQQVDFLKTIRSNVERMQVLVSDLQDISRIETGQLRLEVQTTTLHEALEEALHVMQGQIEGKEQCLQVDLPADLPPVQADPTRLSQVLINLLSNACKYTPEGGALEVLGRVDEGYVTCTISDTGIGIPPEEQERLFTKFFRGDDDAVRSQVGTGLGLCIVKSLVELQGGTLTVESSVGEGSTFTFSVPLAS